MPLSIGPQTRVADQIHSEKHRGKGESFKEATSRIANALRDSEEHYFEFRDILRWMRFLPGGRIQSAMGSTRKVTAMNCFVSGRIEDSYVDGSGSIMARATEAAATMRMGGGIGYDFSTLRPRDSLIRKLQSNSSGPVSFMHIFNAIGRATRSAGNRMGAQMGVLRIDHPDIEEFIHAKQNENQLRGFNISVAVTDEFMQALSSGRAFALRFNGEVYREVDPEELWDALMRSTWEWAEPGVIFIDRVNEYNNLRYCEQIYACNPCGEQCLPPFGACLLGSFNLAKYVDQSDGRYYFQMDELEHDIPIVVRAMDNVIDRTRFPLFEQEKEALGKRRMGLGVTGLANAGEALGHPYGTPGFCVWEAEVLSAIARGCYRAGVAIAREKGPFPEFVGKDYARSRYLANIDPEGELRDLIQKHGIRNSHYTSIAPTGTISLTADNVSSGIENVLAHDVRRLIRYADGEVEETIQDYGVRAFGVRGKTTVDVTLDEHLAVTEAAQRYVDSAVSKTVNVSKSTTWEDFKSVYRRAWERGLKGITTYRAAGKRGGVIRDASEGSSCRIDPATGRRECE